MKKRKQYGYYVLVVGIGFAIFTISAWLKPADTFSVTERRQLAQFPEITGKSIKTGLWMTQLESYLQDQFPMREELRTWKAITYQYVLGQKDNHNVYVQGNQISKLQYPYEPKAVQRACQKFQRIYEQYIQGTDAAVYTALIPDKNYFLAEVGGYPCVDYEQLYEDYRGQMNSFSNYVELRDYLELEDYYRTDAHWRQEKIQDVAEVLAQQMGITLLETYELVTMENPFYGVYYGQAARKLEPDQITYMDRAGLKSCTVYDHQNQKEIPVYDRTLGKGRDPYELFLGGSLSVITIENPEATTQKELVLIRDSFGSSLAPYLIEGYQKITLLDARYLHESLIGKYVTFENQDVLFLHSTSVINELSSFS